jgi:thiamine monophosphate synthase
MMKGRKTPRESSSTVTNGVEGAGRLIQMRRKALSENTMNRTRNTANKVRELTRQNQLY